MRVVSHSSDMLIVEDRATFWSLLIGTWVLIGLGLLISGLLALDLVRVFWGGTFGVLAIVMFLLILRRVRVYFDRANDLVEIRTKGVRRTTRQQFKLRDLAAARVQTSGGDTETYRVALIFENPHRVIATGEVYDSSRSSQRAADAINDWLAC